MAVDGPPAAEPYPDRLLSSFLAEFNRPLTNSELSADRIIRIGSRVQSRPIQAENKSSLPKCVVSVTADELVLNCDGGHSSHADAPPTFPSTCRALLSSRWSRGRSGNAEREKRSAL